jgi:hypothetical protein
MFIRTRSLLGGVIIDFLMVIAVLSGNNIIEKQEDSISPIPICGTPGAYLNQELAIRNTLLLKPELPPYLVKVTEPIEYDVGDPKDFYAYDMTKNIFYKVSSTCQAATEKTYIFVENSEWDNERVTQNALDNFIKAFEKATPRTSLDSTKGIFTLDSTYFGQPSDIDNDSHITILVLDIKDNYNQSGIFIAGYFHPNDQSSDPYSNKMDIIYVDSNPGNPQSIVALSTVAHEFQHLIHHHIDPDEKTWVNEGCSEYASFICGYRDGFTTRQLKYFLNNPDRSLESWSYGDDVLADYAKVALWTVYLGEQFGVDLMPLLVAEQAKGKTGVTNALSVYGSKMTCDSVITNWVIANFLDDTSLMNGEYGYNSIDIPTPATLNSHPAYPVDSPEENISYYAAEYIKFLGIDETARLYFNGKDNKILKAQLIKLGKFASVETLELNANNDGQYSLAGLGTEYEELVLVPTCYDYQSSYFYSVTTEVEDITPPQIIAGPYESIPTASSVTIFWQTDEFCSSFIEYGTDPNYGNTITDNTLKVTHQMTLSDLSPGTHYNYRIGSKDRFDNGPVYSADFSFTTSSLSANEVTTVQQAHSIGYSARNIARDSNKKIHLVWHELEDPRRFVYYSNSDDNGIAWSTPMRVDNTLYFGGMPGLAIDKNDNLHVAWHAQVQSGDKYAVYYSKSTNNGLNWSVPLNVSTSLSDQDNLYPSIAVDHFGNPHVVWTHKQQTDTNMGEIFYNYSSDRGNNWEIPINISNSKSDSCFVPTIELNSRGRAFICYADNGNRKLYVSNSSDYQIWETPIAINESGYLYDAMHSFTIDDNDIIHVVYSDNYTPGDIRIMYSSYNNTEWDIPAPIAKSVTGGFVDYPQVGSDNSNNLYVIYRDNLASSRAKMLGKYAVVNKVATEDALKKTQAEKGDIFILCKKSHEWSTPGNLSNDMVDSEYPELASQVTSNAIDIIWISGDNAPFKLKHLSFGISGENDMPPVVVTTYPVNDSTNVPIYNKVTKIKATFSKRMLADSLISSNVIVESVKTGIIPITISYNEALKEMVVTPDSNFSTNDTILVTLKANIVDLANNHLDGDNDGMPESSPTDDYHWRFVTADIDQVPPTFTIGVLQNPVFTRYMDMYVIASEYLSGAPEMVVGNQNVNLQEINENLHIYKGEYKISDFGTINIAVTGTDLGSNQGSGSKVFATALITAKLGGFVEFGSKNCLLSVPAEALTKDEYITIVPLESSEKFSFLYKINLMNDNDDRINWLSPIYTIGHSNLNFSNPAFFRLYLPTEHSKDIDHTKLNIYYFDQTWIRMETSYDNSKGFLGAEIRNPGNYRIGYTENLTPQKFQIAQNHPNPFNSQTIIKYQIPENSMVSIKIYNMIGQMVSELINEFQTAGFYEIHWNGTDEQGQNVTSGIYLYQISCPTFKTTKKMLLLR